MPMGARVSGCVKVTAHGRSHSLPKQHPAEKQPSLPKK